MEKLFDSLMEYNMYEFGQLVLGVNKKVGSLFKLEGNVIQIDEYMVIISNEFATLLKNLNLRFSGLLLNSIQSEKKEELENQISVFEMKMILSLKHLKIKLIMMHMQNDIFKDLSKLKNI